MRNVLVAFVCCFYLISNGQEKDTLIWDKNPQFSEITTENEKENAIAIFFDETNDYYYNDDGELVGKNIIHKKFRLNSDESIDQFNKIYVSLKDVIELIDIKARAIKPDGKVVDFDEDNIKEIEDEESEQNYKIFAIDGIEKGDEIEYYIIRKIYGKNFGRKYFQDDYPIQKGVFKLTVPDNLLYDVKGYNDFPSATHTTLEDGRNHYSCEMENVPLLKGEKFAYFNSRRARVEFRLDYNTSRGQEQKLTWDDAAQRIYGIIYLDKDEKVLKKFISSMKIPKGSTLDKVKHIEDYIKSNIFIQDFSIPEFSDLAFILKNKVTNVRGAVILYANIFKALDINHQVVLTVERSVVKFDKDFQSWNYLDSYMIYLVDEDLYIEPENVSFRIGCVNGELTATDGLFIKLVKVGSFESAIAKIKYIEPTPFDANFDNMKINIDVDTEAGEAHVVTTRGFKGLSGGYIGRYYMMMNEEEKEELLKDIMGDKIPTSDIDEIEVLDDSDIESLSDAEFIIYSEFTTPSLIEEAGNKILLNVGETIGTQVEMYFEEDRTATVENDFNRSYLREITLQIPKGYKILNPEIADMMIIEKMDDKNAYGFESSHKLDGDVYKITINEYYKEIFAGHEHFNGYKDVVNAAADFNKIVLVIEKM